MGKTLKIKEITTHQIKSLNKNDIKNIGIKNNNGIRIPVNFNSKYFRNKIKISDYNFPNFQLTDSLQFV